MTSFKKKVDKSLNKFGNTMADLQEFGHEIERIPEKVVKGTAKAAVKAPVAVAKCGADVGVGVLKEFSGILAHGARELTGTKKRKGPYRSNLAKGWFE